MKGDKKKELPKLQLLQSARNCFIYGLLYFLVMILIDFFISFPSLSPALFKDMLIVGIISISVFFFAELFYVNNMKKRYLTSLILLPFLVFLADFLPYYILGHPVYWLGNIFRGLINANTFVKSIVALFPIVFLMKYNIKKGGNLFYDVFIRSFAIMLIVYFTSFVAKGISWLDFSSLERNISPSLSIIISIIYFLCSLLGIVFSILLFTRKRLPLIALIFILIIPCIALIFVSPFRYILSQFLIFLILGGMACFSYIYLKKQVKK